MKIKSRRHHMTHELNKNRVFIQRPKMYICQSCEGWAFAMKMSSLDNLTMWGEEEQSKEIGKLWVAPPYCFSCYPL